MMADYISREAAIEAVKHAWAKGLEPSQYIEILPAADVAPVVHGWYEVYIRIDAEHPNINVAKMRLNAGRKHLCQGCMDDIKKALDEKRGHKGEVGDR